MPKMSLQYILDHADELAERFESAEFEHLPSKPAAPYLALQDAAQRRVQAESDVAGAVADCRSAGWSWADIGRALGVSAQAAQQRYGQLTKR